jgi:hypothetical protein
MLWLQILKKSEHQNRIVSLRIGAGCCSTKITPSAAGFQPPGIVARRCIDFHPDRQHLILTNLASDNEFHLETGT